MKPVLHPKYLYSRYIRRIFLSVVLVLFVSVFKINAQHDPRTTLNYRDSLLRLLDQQKGDDLGFSMLRMADYWMRLDNGSDSLSVPYAQKAYSIFKQSNNGFGMAWAKFEEGTAYMDMNKLDSALTVLTISANIPISDTAKRKNELLGTVWSQISAVYDRKADFENSTKISLNKALPYFEAAKKQARISSIYSGVAVTFLNLNQYEKAVYYFKKELLNNSFRKDEKFYAIDFSRLGFCLTKLNQLKEAKPYFDSAYNILEGSAASFPWIKYYHFKGYWEQQNGNYAQALQDFGYSHQHW